MFRDRSFPAGAVRDRNIFRPQLPRQIFCATTIQGFHIFTDYGSKFSRKGFHAVDALTVATVSQFEQPTDAHA
jgi:hypothetical protein